MVESKQKQYQKGSDNVVSAFRNYMANVSSLVDNIPAYTSDTRKRDKYLRTIARSENILSGVLSTVVSRNANRSFSLIGGVRQVSKYSNIVHDVNNGEGWTDFITKLASAYYSTNFGYGAEIGFDEKKTPASLYSLDSTKSRLLGAGGDSQGYTLYQYPKRGKVNKFKVGQYIHDNSMPSIEEELKGAGVCAIERSLNAAKIISGVMQYYLEKVSAAPSQGIVLFKDISLEEFEKAVALAEEQNKSLDAEMYKGVMALFTENGNSDIKVTSFSSLPDNFEYKDFIEVVMQIYALAFNYPVGQFWSISSGSFGRTGEMKVQEEMATEKGELEFAISLQQQLHQYFFPESLTFKFDIRNDSGDFVKETVRSERISQAKELVASGIITPEEARTYLANHGDIPQEWAEALDDDVEEELTVVREDFRKSAIENSSMISRMIKNSEPIIAYTWNPTEFVEPSNLIGLGIKNRSLVERVYEYSFPRGSINVVYESLEQAMRKRVF